MDADGRVQLPIGIRFRLDLDKGDRFAIDHLGDGTIILKKIEKGNKSVDTRKSSSLVANR